MNCQIVTFLLVHVGLVVSLNVHVGRVRVKREEESHKIISFYWWLLRGSRLTVFQQKETWAPLACIHRLSENPVHCAS